jgi:hypothetical protein
MSYRLPNPEAKWADTNSDSDTRSAVVSIARLTATGECIATVRRAAIATWIADVTASGEIETGTMRTGIGTTGVTPIETDPGVA